jgi:hypothetical protein
VIHISLSIFEPDHPRLKSDDESSERNFNVKIMSGEERLVWLNYPRIAVTPQKEAGRSAA